MKYYSEKLDRLFDTPEALAEAESVKTKKKKSATATTEQPVKEDVPTKKQLAAEVEAAEEIVKQAYANYTTAKSQVEELSKKYLAQVEEILNPAEKAVKDAEKTRYDAIKKFNDSFGAYQVTYTGARAADDMIKAIMNMDDRLDKFLKNVFWF